MKEKVPDKCEECGRGKGILQYPGRSVAIIIKKTLPTWPWLCQYCRAKWSRGY